MYVRFSCPLCQSSNFISGTPLGESGSYPEIACRACKSLIIWVGSERVAALKRTGANDARVRVDRGVLATLADAEAGVAIGSKEDAADLMKTETAGAAVADIYSQGERIKEFSPTDKSIQEGVCNGQSLHWIRRVLQGGRAEYQVQEKKVISGPSGAQVITRSPQTMDAKRKAQHMGGVFAQKATVTAELEKYTKAAADVRDQEHKKARAAYDEAWALLDKKWDDGKRVYDRKMLELGAKKNSNGGWSYAVNEKTSAVIQDWQTVKAFVDAAKDKLSAPTRAPAPTGGVYKHHWDEIAKDLDSKLLQASIARKKRPFSGVVALKSLNRETCAGGTTAFADKLLADSDFKVGVCALVSAGLKVGIGESGGKISGHAIAVHYAKSNLLRIFDPNIGVFTCTSKGGLKAALVAMIDVGWVKVFGWQLDDQFGYALFEARPSAVDLPPKQQAVHYTVSAETTAIQNKTVIPSSTKAPVVVPTKPTVVIKKPVTPTAGTGVAKGGGNAKASLRERLVAARDDTKNFLAKRAGVATADGLGYVKLDQELCKELMAAKIVHSDLKGQSPMGDWLQKGTVNQILAVLK